MPPQGMPRPDAATLDAFATTIEKTIDDRALRSPDPGHKPVHRLNRTEYGNAIRDLLDLEIDPASLLPADDESHGFDNIAGVLRISPSLLEQYLAAARSISCRPSPSASNANRSTLIPGRPSGVSDAGISASIPASTLHPITEVANPVIDCAAVCAHAGDCAVMMTRAPRMPKASANVSTIRTPRICSSAPDSVVIPNGSLRRVWR